MRCRLERGWRRCWWSSLHARGNRKRTGKIHLLVSSSGTIPEKLNLLAGGSKILTHIQLEHLRSSIPLCTAALSPNFLKIHKPEAYFNPSPRLEFM